ncbi:MAG: class I tRNA ligase family protein, partial [Candidatus Methylomirabilales bacterium]
FYHSLHNFCAVDLSGFYLDVLKDRLYTSGRTSRARRAAQTALYHLLTGLVRLMAPVLSFTAEEVWAALPKTGGEAESVHLEAFPAVEGEWLDDALGERWERLLSVRDQVLKALEEVRQAKTIGNSLEAHVDLHAGTALLSFLRPYAAELPTLFIVSSVTLHPDDEVPEDTLTVRVSRARGLKCERCWTYRETVGKRSEHPTLCDRCVTVLAGRP